jgi:hypothetical protein
VFVTAAWLVGCSSLDPNTGAALPPPVDMPDADVSDTGQPEDDADPGAVNFGRDIRPLMNRPSPPKGDTMTPKGCKGCHYRTEPSHNGIDLGGLDLTTLGSLRVGGGSSGRRIVVAGKPAESALVQALHGQYPYSAQMPKTGPYWKDEEIELVERWISEGAKGADGE